MPEIRLPAPADGPQPLGPPAVVRDADALAAWIDEQFAADWQANKVKPAPAADTGNFYVVKENDTLWKIASSQLGSGVRWEEIKQLNTDVLKGSEQVRVGMRLKLPNKAVASAN